MSKRLTARNEHGGVISTRAGEHIAVEQARLRRKLCAYEDLGTLEEITELMEAMREEE